MKNPIVQGWYADPESRVYDGKVYLYVTRSLAFEEQTNLDVVMSEDLENFKNSFIIPVFNKIKNEEDKEFLNDFLLDLSTKIGTGDDVSFGCIVS